MKYEFTSRTIEGSLIFDYTEDGKLAVFHCNALLSDAQEQWLSANFPMTVELLRSLREKSKEAKLIELPDNVTFELFYERYGKKEGKEMARRAWVKLTEVDQQRAFRYIARYDSILSMNKWQSKLMPATYLNQRRWMD